MLYLEDYLELIEQLPNEFKCRFAKIREIDLQVQNDIDSLDVKVKDFFQNSRKAKLERKQTDYNDIEETYKSTLEVADEKIQTVHELQDLLQRYIRRLIHELEKFKMELEADNPGITELLEKRSLELDRSGSPYQNIGTNCNDTVFRHLSTVSHKRKYDNEFSDSMCTSSTSHSEESSLKDSTSQMQLNNGSSLASRQSSVQHPGNKANSPNGVTVTYGLNNVSGCNNAAVQAAAAQALSTTMQMQQGRKSGIKASLLIQNYGNLEQKGISSSHKSNKDDADRNSIALKSQHTYHSISKDTTKQSSKRKIQQKSGSAVTNICTTSVSSTLFSSSSAINSEVQGVMEDQNTTFENPDDLRYCLCNQISYGEMIGCDNPDCPIEWFHYGCVGITETPQGKWYCPQCTATMKRRSGRTGHK